MDGKGILRVLGAILLAVGCAIGGVEWQKYREKQAGAPNLKFERQIAGDGFVDVIVRSQSSRPTAVHGYVFKPVALVQPAPEEAKPLPPPPRLRNWFQRLRPDDGKAGEAIDPDDLVIEPPALTIGKWYTGVSNPFQIDAYKTGRVRVYVVSKEGAGAKYRVKVRIGYGDPENPTQLSVPEFEIDVVRAR